MSEQYNPLLNKFLKLRSWVKMTSETNKTICGLDSYFEAAHLDAWVTSIYRSPDEQLKLVIYYARRAGLPVDFAQDDILKFTAEGNHFVWQDTWSRLLASGIIINPPVDAICLGDYISARTGENMKGKLIYASPHSRRRAFDIEGIESLQVIQEAERNQEVGIRSYLVERKNNAIHVDVV